MLRLLRQAVRDPLDARGAGAQAGRALDVPGRDGATPPADVRGLPGARPLCRRGAGATGWFRAQAVKDKMSQSLSILWSKLGVKGINGWIRRALRGPEIASLQRVGPEGRLAASKLIR